MTYHETATHADTVSTEQSGAWLLPLIGSGILTLLWGAYTILFVAHMVMLPMPAL
jgi:hypothetical protein